MRSSDSVAPAATFDEQEAVVGSATRLSFWELAALGLILVAYFLARWPSRELPLIRDEGEYAQLGQVMREGWVPYRDIYNQKPPVVFVIFAAVQAVCGEGVVALRIATTVWCTATIAALWWAGRRLLGAVGGLAAALVAAELLFDLAGIFHSASTEVFMLLWCALGLACWYPSRGRGAWRLIAAGVFAALAMQTKQTGLALAAFFVADRIWAAFFRREQGDSWRFAGRDMAIVAGGFAGVNAAILGYFAAHGALNQYWECVWVNNFAYLGERHRAISLTAQIASLAELLIGKWRAGVWIAGLLGCVTAGYRARRADAGGLWLLCAAFFGLAAMTGAIYVQYIVPVIIPLALGSGYLFAWYAEIALPRNAAVSVKLSAVAAALLILSGPLLVNLPKIRNAHRWIANMAAIGPFDDSPVVAKFLAEHTEPNEPILVLGTEPEIYYYAQRKPASRMVITYPAFAPYPYSAALAEELFQGFADRRLRYVVLVNYPNGVTEFTDLLPDFKERIAGAERVLQIQNPRMRGATLEVYRLSRPALP